MDIQFNALLLNAGYEPLRIVPWHRAFVLVFHGKVDILEQHDAHVRSIRREFKVPAVIRLRRWVNLQKVTPVIRFSRANLYARDEHRCQYCHRTFPEKDLTLDHVIPVSKGGKKTWANIVTACLRCNQKKGNCTPEQANLHLLKRPSAPKWLPGIGGSIQSNRSPSIWEPYLTQRWDTLLNR